MSRQEARLLGFYDRLRERVLATVERRGGRMSSATVRALLVVPDIFMLLVRLALDPEVPRPTRALIGGALAYFVLPIDLLPEAMLGPAGYLEDLVLASAVLAQAFGGELETHAQKYWSGRQELRVVLRDVTSTAHSLLGDNVNRRLEKMLERRGLKLEPTPPRRRVERRSAESREWEQRGSELDAAMADQPDDPDVEDLSPERLLEHGEEHA